MKITTLIPTFNRDDLLWLTLCSYKNQELIEQCEVIVLDEGATNKTKELCSQFSFVKYLATGRDGRYWRCPSFAYNIGAKRALGDVLLLTSPEILNLDPFCIKEAVLPVLANEMVGTYPIGKYDKDGIFLDRYKQGIHSSSLFDSLPDLNNHANGQPLHFFQAVSKKLFLDIGGYDEDFIGLAYDDNDLTDRLFNAGSSFEKTKARVVHLWHSYFRNYHASKLCRTLIS